jgi:hypothetical protein
VILGTFIKSPGDQCAQRFAYLSSVEMCHDDSVRESYCWQVAQVHICIQIHSPPPNSVYPFTTSRWWTSRADTQVGGFREILVITALHDAERISDAGRRLMVRHVPARPTGEDPARHR